VLKGKYLSIVKMRVVPVLIVLLLLTFTACKITLKIVNVSAPAINCKFDSDCTITVSDTTAHFTLPGATGDAFLQSRTIPPGEPGTAAAGLYAYLYRIDLRQLTGLTAAPCVSQLTIEFGPVVSLDYDDDGAKEHVFVVTAGGLGSVGPSSAYLEDGIVTFNFNPPVCCGSAPGTGQSSFFFGLTSTKPLRAITAQIKDTTGTTTPLNARAPNL
jgi:hypothetical protein